MTNGTCDLCGKLKPTKFCPRCGKDLCHSCQVDLWERAKGFGKAVVAHPVTTLRTLLFGGN
jgi:hypothetical protein